MRVVLGHAGGYTAALSAHGKFDGHGLQDRSILPLHANAQTLAYLHPKVSGFSTEASGAGDGTRQTACVDLRCPV